MSQLPPNWAQGTIDDLVSDRAAITDGPFGSNLKTAHYTDSGPRVVRLQNIGDGVFVDQSAHISEAHYESLTKHSVLAGDVVVASLGAELPRACVIPAYVPPAIVKADCIRVRVHPRLDARYLSHALNSPQVRRAAADLIHGVGRPRLGLKTIRALPLPIAPENEQRRIVAAIEEHFSRVDAADESLRRAKLKLEQLRSVALADALKGACKARPLADLLVSLRNGMFVSRPGTEPPGVAIFRISAVRPLALDVNDVRYAAVDPATCEDFLVNEGDLLFTRYSGNPQYVGACARVRRLPRPTLHPDKLIRAVVDRSVADPAYVELACTTGVTRDAIRARRKTTAGQVGIAGGQLKSVPVPLPPLDEQRSIVAKVQQRLSVMGAMAAEVMTAQRRSAALRRAILERAFRGELVPQDPSDESASVLLKDIAAHWEGAAEPSRRRSKIPA